MHAVALLIPNVMRFRNSEALNPFCGVCLFTENINYFPGRRLMADETLFLITIITLVSLCETR